MLTLAQAPAITSDSAISLALLIILIGATWRISSLLTSLGNSIANMDRRMEKLDNIPERLQAVEHDLKGIQRLEAEMRMLEDDINRLWAQERADSAEDLRNVLRRTKGRRVVDNNPNGD